MCLLANAREGTGEKPWHMGKLKQSACGGHISVIAMLVLSHTASWSSLSWCHPSLGGNNLPLYHNVLPCIAVPCEALCQCSFVSASLLPLSTKYCCFIWSSFSLSLLLASLSLLFLLRSTCIALWWCWQFLHHLWFLQKIACRRLVYVGVSVGSSI